MPSPALISNVANAQNVKNQHSFRAGVIGNQPVDGRDIGRDMEGAVGEYKTPNALDGEVENVKIDAKTPKATD